MKRLSTLFFILLLGLKTADADVLTDVTVGTTYDTNVDGVYSGASSFVTQLSASVMRPVEMDASYLRFFFRAMAFCLATMAIGHLQPIAWAWILHAI